MGQPLVTQRAIGLALAALSVDPQAEHVIARMIARADDQPLLAVAAEQMLPQVDGLAVGGDHLARREIFLAFVGKSLSLAPLLDAFGQFPAVLPGRGLQLLLQLLDRGAIGCGCLGVVLVQGIQIT